MTPLPSFGTFPKIHPFTRPWAWQNFCPRRKAANFCHPGRLYRHDELMKPLSISLLYQLWKKTHLGFWGTNFPRSEASPDMRMQFSRSSDVTFLRAILVMCKHKGCQLLSQCIYRQNVQPGQVWQPDSRYGNQETESHFFKEILFHLAHFGITPKQVHRIDKKLNFQPPPERLSISFIKLLKLNFISAFSIQLSSKWAIIGLIKKKTCGLQTLKNDLADYGSPIMNIGQIKLTWTPSFLQRNWFID